MSLIPVSALPLTATDEADPCHVLNLTRPHRVPGPHPSATFLTPCTVSVQPECGGRPLIRHVPLTGEVGRSQASDIESNTEALIPTMLALRRSIRLTAAANRP